MVKVKIGAIIKEVPEGSLKWYLMAGWKVSENESKTNIKKKSTPRGNV